MQRVTIVDYGRGNLFSLSRALTHVGAEPVLASGPDQIAEAKQLILPGVGAFGDGMEELRKRRLEPALQAYCASGKPLLGICLGMQLLMDEGEEFGVHAGLKLVPGRVVRFDTSHNGSKYKVPQIGWNEIFPAEGRSWAGTILEDVPKPAYMYFVHSYIAELKNPEHGVAETQYAGRSFCSVLKAGNIWGCQFHPEKSGETGLLLLKRWIAQSLQAVK